MSECRARVTGDIVNNHFRKTVYRNKKENHLEIANLADSI